MRILRRARATVSALSIPLGVAALTSCTSLSAHTASPYDRDPELAVALEHTAAAWCAERGQPGGPPTRPFRFDGCSWWPDGDPSDTSDYRDCCQVHDYAYWCGGSREGRAAADDALRMCVAKKRGDAYGRLIWLGVRVGGHPAVPMYFRWGYGHAYTGRYPSPTAGEAEAR